MSSLPPYNVYPLGDSALIIDFGNVIDAEINKIVNSLFYQLTKQRISGVIEIIPAYSSLTIYYDVFSIRQKTETTAFEWISATIKKLLESEQKVVEQNVRSVKIPVCYEKEFAPDLEFIAEQNKISIPEIIQLHTSVEYRVYMLGFLPGFAYMGMVDEKISCARKSKPNTVEAGSVGIAGRQTGVYPLRSPGGWQILGRTPLQLFDKNKEEPTLFHVGDIVQFYSITKDEFEDIKGRIA